MIAAAVFVADQASKYTLETLTGHAFRRILIPGLLDLVHTHNRGVAFGLLAETEARWVTWGLVAFSVVAIAAMAWLLAAGRITAARTRAGVALILGGAAGNFLDRLMHGSVLDFVDLYAGSYHWPAFNVADSAITIGAVLIVLDLVFDRSRPAEEAQG